METETRDQIRSRLEGVNVPRFERYLSVGIGLAATGIGAAAWLMGPGRVGKIAGAAVAVAGAAMVARGVSGRCPVTRALAMRAHRPSMFGGANQGEGDHRAARSYDEHLRDFIDDDRVEPAARAAAAAIDGPEGPGLRAAEELGKAPMKRGPI